MPDKRIALIALDGRHVWLGRYSEPTIHEYENMHKLMLERRLKGKVYEINGDYWAKDESLTFRLITILGGSFDDDVIEPFLEKRHESLSRL